VKKLQDEQGSGLTDPSQRLELRAYKEYKETLGVSRVSRTSLWPDQTDGSQPLALREYRAYKV
jgi:hypothetical protein